MPRHSTVVFLLVVGTRYFEVAEQSSPRAVENGEGGELALASLSLLLLLPGWPCESLASLLELSARCEVEAAL